MHLVAAFSDIHVLSTLGLFCGPELALPDGGFYKPSAAQRWLEEQWYACWEQVAELAKGADDITIICNGDAFEGVHHHTTQLISHDTHVQQGLALRCMQPIIDLEPSRWYFTKGTESHVGRAAKHEKDFALILSGAGQNVVPAHDGDVTWNELWLEVEGVLFHVKHHGRMGRREHTRANTLNSYAYDLQSYWNRKGIDLPDIAIRSHLHETGVSNRDMIKPWLVQLPCFQLKTGYGHKITDKLGDIGMYVFLCEDEMYTPYHLECLPDPPKVEVL